MIKRKHSVITFALVVAVALIGTGYAAWGTEIFSNTTLRTGGWNIVVDGGAPCDFSPIAGDQVFYYRVDGTQMQTIDIDYGRYDLRHDSAISGATRYSGTNYVYTLRPTISEDRHTVKFDFYNMHPGTQADTNFEIRNMGSIPAKVKNIAVTFNDTAYENLTGELKMLCDAIKVNGSFYKRTGYGLPIKIGDLPEDTLLVNLEAAIEDMLVTDSMMLKPKESISSMVKDSGEIDVNHLRFRIPMDSLNESQGSAQSLKVGIAFDFTQYNQKTQQ